MIDRACISLNNNCNLRCKYCHFQDKQKDFSSFALYEVLEVIENVHSYCEERGIKLFKLGIVGAGEPMLKKDVVFALLEHVRANNYSEIKMYTITNGTMLTYDDIVKFYEYRNEINVCFSLDGFEELHNCGRARYSDVMKSIERYKAVFGKSPAINATVNALSVKHKERLLAFFKENDLTNVTFSKLVGYAEKDLKIADGDFAEFMQYAKAEGLSCRQFNAAQIYDCTMYGKLCGVGRTNIFITPEGIYPCGRFYKNNEYLLGNYNLSLSEIERKMRKFAPVNDGECYYSKYVEENV